MDNAVARAGGKDKPRLATLAQDRFNLIDRTNAVQARFPKTCTGKTPSRQRDKGAVALCFDAMQACVVVALKAIAT